MGIATAVLGLTGDALLALAILAGFSAVTITLLIPVILAHPLAAVLLLLLLMAAFTE